MTLFVKCITYNEFKTASVEIMNILTKNFSFVSLDYTYLHLGDFLKMQPHAEMNE